MRRKDEASETGGPSDFQEDEAEVDLPEDVGASEKEDPLSQVEEELRGKLGGKYAYNRISQDNSWDGLLGQMSRIGAFFKLGRLQAAYINGGASGDFILLPEKQTAVISVDSCCPRDRIIQALCR
jgi:hypothetical protein